MLLPKYFSRNAVLPYPNLLLDDRIGIVVVIPAFKEDNLLATINSLDSCEDPGCKVVVVVVNNLSENASESDKRVQLELNERIRQLQLRSPYLTVLPIEAFDLPSNNFGAG